MTEAKTVETEYPNYIFEERKYQEKGEFEVPARILDLLISFVESSTKSKYVWNNPPYRKVREDGSYWQVRMDSVKVQVGEEMKEKNAVCVLAVAWASEGEVCLLSGDALVLTVYYAGRFSQMWTDPDTTEVKLKSKYRDGELPLFDVYRKLKFYSTLISKTKEEEHETPAAETKTG